MAGIMLDLHEHVLPRVMHQMSVAELCVARVVGSNWLASADSPDIWVALARRNFSGHFRSEVVGRPSFVELVMHLRALLAQERESASLARNGQPCMCVGAYVNIGELVTFAHCRQPCPPCEELGLDLLIAAGTPSHLAGLLRMDDTTEWVSELPHEEASDLYLSSMRLLNLMSTQRPDVREGLRLESHVFNGFQDLQGVLECYVLDDLVSLRELHPVLRVDEDGELRIIGFDSMDCRHVTRSSPHVQMLRDTCSMYFHLFAGAQDIASDSFALTELLKPEVKDCHVLALELSGAWCTGMYLGGRHVDGSPGNFDLVFDPNGTLTGAGHDLQGAFTISGFWTPEMQCMLKETPGGYNVGLVGFRQDDGSIHGAWVFRGSAGGFWCWKKPPQRFSLPVR